jgi:hypothetical protein
MNRKVIFRTEAGWFCRYEGPGAAEYIAVIGADVIPLPWTAQAPAERVLADVKRLVTKYNEDFEVVYELNPPLSWTEVPGEVR